VVVVVVAVAIAVDVAGIAVAVVVLTVAVVVIAVAVALNAVAAPVEEALQVAAPLLLVVVLAVVLAVVLPVVVPHLEAGRPQLAPLLNVVHSHLLRMSRPLASHVQGMGPLAKWSRYSPIISPQNSIRALYITMTVRDTLPSRKDVSDMSSGYSVSM